MDASKYALLEQTVQDMRADTLQVLRTPYFHNCKAARSVRQVLQQVGELCKQMRAETVLLSKQKRASEGGTGVAGFSVDEPNKRPKHDGGFTPGHGLSQSGLKAEEKPDVAVPQENRFAGSKVGPVSSPQSTVPKPETKVEVTRVHENGPLPPIIGGSPDGWNFIMFPSKPKKEGTSAS